MKQFEVLVLKQRYNTQELEDLIPYYGDLREALVEKTMEEKDKVGFEIDEDDIIRFRSELVQICSILGIRLDFLDRHAKISEDVRDHWTVNEWLAIFLQENYEFLSLSEKTSLSRELLVSIGFDPMGFAIEQILERAGPRKEHIEPSEWADIFINDEFEYNPLLSDSERFPFRSDFTNQWFQVAKAFEEDDIRVENLERPRQVNIVNLVTNDSEIYRHQFELTNFPQQLEDDTHVVLFHGTDHESARDIVSRGIDLYLGRPKRDFSDRIGFYLTNSFDDAIGWASSTTAKPCVLVFRVTRECLISAKTLRLQENNEMWHELVYGFRRGKDSDKMRRKLSAYEAIEGPIALLSRNPTTGELSVEKKAFSYQMCLTSDDFAEKFQQSLHSIVFYDSREIC